MQQDSRQQDAADETAGTFSRTTLTVRGYHLDGYGHVNNARYLEFYEEGRWSSCSRIWTWRTSSARASRWWR